MAKIAGPVTGGVDTHAGTHVAAVVDQVGRVLGTGRIVSRGRSICFLEGQLHDDQGKLLATAMATSKIGRVVGKTEDV